MELASRVLGKLKFTDDASVVERMACTAWAGAVGKRIAAHTQPLKLVRQTLVVEVEDATWQRQLFGLQYQILANLRKKIGVVVSDVEFRVAPCRKPIQRAEIPAEFSLAAPHDDADAITDPILRRIYKSKRKQALA